MLAASLLAAAAALGPFSAAAVSGSHTEGAEEFAAPAASAGAAGAGDVRDRTFAPIPGLVRAPLIANLPGAAGAHPGAHISTTRAFGRGGSSLGRLSTVIDMTGARIALRRAVAYETVTGDSVWVSVSRRYSENSRADRRLVDYVDSLLHADEIEGLRLMVLRPDEIAMRCGANTAACYFPEVDTIVVVGEDRFGGLPTDYVLAHEYGHRIAQYRANPPFRGGAFWHGPKHWATYERVCPQLSRGRLSIGRFAYWDFPGENFAEAYARYHIRGEVRWQYAPSLRPDRGSFAAIERDVLVPWQGTRVSDFIRALPPRGVHRYRIATPLDGRITADLYGLEGARFSFELWQAGRRVARAPRPTADFRLSQPICGKRQAELIVRAGRRGGSYRLVIDRP